MLEYRILHKIRSSSLGAAILRLDVFVSVRDGKIPQVQPQRPWFGRRVLARADSRKAVRLC